MSESFTPYRWPEANQIARERQTYEEAWSLPQYGDFSPGMAALPWFEAEVALRPGASICDLGCGTGKAGVALSAKGFDVTLADITPAGLVADAQELRFAQQVIWEPIPASYDYIYCCDVLEHVPTEWTMLAITQMLQAARIGVCLSVGLEPDAYGALVGIPLHLTVQPFTWWRDHLRMLGTLRASCDRVSHALFYVAPRP
jgi:SAM-dependent methyltransferase